MLTVFDKPNSNANCSKSMSRRKLIQAAGAGMLGVNLPDVLQAESLTLPNAPRPRAKNVIFMHLFGGPSQLETFDLKPDAPEEIRGPFKPTACKTPGLLIGEHLPGIASISDRLAVVKTMTHSFNDHSGGGHYVQTGHRWHINIGGGFNVTPNDWPAMGSVTKYFDVQSDRISDAPTYVVLPNALGSFQEKGGIFRPGETAGWLGGGYEPLVTSIKKKSVEDNPYWRDCDDEELDFSINGLKPHEGMTINRYAKRSSLLDQINQQQVALGELSKTRVFNKYRQRALELVLSSKAREAFDVTKEPDSVRDTYGRHLYGQSSLVARRLIEAGSRFVTVQYDCVDGYSWDSHRNSDDVKKYLLPTFDQAFTALVTDLEDRGLLDDTLIVAMGEMGRTPKANSTWGRNHWSTLFPAVLVGGGIKQGFIYGDTDKHAAYATEHPVSPEDMAATIFTALGINPDWQIPDAADRPHLLTTGNAVMELFA